jgi:hypothetical protein
LGKRIAEIAAVPSTPNGPAYFSRPVFASRPALRRISIVFKPYKSDKAGRVDRD